jgi:leucyl aminopeptidase
MKVTLTDANPAQVEADAIVIGVAQADSANESIFGSASEVDKATDGLITRLIEKKEITGKQNEVTALLAPNGIAATQVVVVGLGDGSNASRQTAFQAAASAAKHLACKERNTIAYYLFADWTPDQIAAGVSGSVVGCHGQDLHRKELNLTPPKEILWHGIDEDSLQRGQILGDAVNLTRRLVNEPPSDMNPEAFADTAAVIAQQCGLESEIWDKAKLEAENCGSLLAVARGSAREPRLVILRHNGGGAAGKTLALVGKGVTFDSGGLSLKPSDSMKTMKCDMAGAATVVGAMQAIARLNLPVNVIGYCGLVENMLGGDCYKLGDVLHARSGKTIEVLNTDAEGRLVLADVLDVAVSSGADRIVDLATLTGACVVALGLDVAGMMTNDQSWCDAVLAAATNCGETAWQLPMFKEYGEQIQSKVADIKNIGQGRWGGAMTAAKFLEEFVGDTPWTHIDIAGPSFLENPKSYIDAGASGAFVRTLVELADSFE